MRTLKNVAAIAIALAFLAGLPAIANATPTNGTDFNHVPDGGTTAMLLGSALAGVGVLRRYLKN
jgi:hypothetical protein